MPEDYFAVHNWFDATKSHMPDFRHRALRHHAEGIFLCEQVFGTTIRNSNGKEVPTRFLGEQHVKEDLGWIPTAKDWLENLRPAGWMGRASGAIADTETPPKEPGVTMEHGAIAKEGAA